MSLSDELFGRKDISLAQEMRLSKRPSSDLLITFAWIEGKKILHAPLTKEWDRLVKQVLEDKDLRGKSGELTLLYGSGEQEKRLLVVGLGEKKKLSKEVLFKAYLKAGQLAFDKELKTLACQIPINLGIPQEEATECLTYAFLQSTYRFDFHKAHSLKDDKPHIFKKITFLGADKKGLEKAEQAQLVCRGIALSKDLINANADDMNPNQLGQIAKEIAKKTSGVKATVHDKKWIEQEKMGLLLAVSRASKEDHPAFIVLEYKGAPKAKSRTVLVGKGITFDTGGLNLKPTGYMETMKCDMSGASIVLSTLYAVALLKLKINLTVVVPSTENAIGPESFKPGDVYTSYSGKTVEIGNTDAEGRLILADALAWSEKNLKPTRIVDVATLTGAMAVALGPSCAGFFSTDDILAKDLEEASDSSLEKLWRMPLIEDYNEQLKSYVADTGNTGKREGGAITAALFLQQFVEHTPWAHLDVAAVTFTKYPVGIYPKYATGYGIKLLVDYFRNQT